MPSQNEIRQRITSTIIESLKSGGLPLGDGLGPPIRMRASL